MDYSTFFEVADQMVSGNTKTEIKLYYSTDGSIIDISYELLDGDYIVLTQSEYDACNQKRGDYTVVEGKLQFTPPKQRTWNLKQEELSRNPYICNR